MFPAMGMELIKYLVKQHLPMRSEEKREMSIEKMWKEDRLILASQVPRE